MMKRRMLLVLALLTVFVSECRAMNNPLLGYVGDEKESPQDQVTTLKKLEMQQKMQWYPDGFESPKSYAIPHAEPKVSPPPSEKVELNETILNEIVLKIQHAMPRAEYDVSCWEISMLAKEELLKLGIDAKQAVAVYYPFDNSFGSLHHILRVDGRLFDFKALPLKQGFEMRLPTLTKSGDFKHDHVKYIVADEGKEHPIYEKFGQTCDWKQFDNDQQKLTQSIVSHHCRYKIAPHVTKMLRDPNYVKTSEYAQLNKHQKERHIPLNLESLADGINNIAFLNQLPNKNWMKAMPWHMVETEMTDADEPFHDKTPSDLARQFGRDFRYLKREEAVAYYEECCKTKPKLRRRLLPLTGYRRRQF